MKDRNELPTCRICNSENLTNLTLTEMMFGTEEQFSYFECQVCNCIQISSYPEDMSSYYPDNYYSFQKKVKINIFYRLFLAVKRLYKKIKRLCYLMILFILGRSIKIGSPTNPLINKFKKFNINFDSNIHDIGCGNGNFLLHLNALGFKNLSGSDAYLKEDILLKKRIELKKSHINEIQDKFHLITLNHVFEHLPDQKETLENIIELLKVNGTVMIRIPIRNSAWERYKTNWIQLDPPRHFYIHSEKSIHTLAEQIGLQVVYKEYDSTEFQFWGSEQAIKGIALMADNSHAINEEKSIFTTDEISNWEDEAKQLNMSSKGDQVILFLQRK